MAESSSRAMVILMLSVPRDLHILSGPHGENSGTTGYRHWWLLPSVPVVSERKSQSYPWQLTRTLSHKNLDTAAAAVKLAVKVFTSRSVQPFSNLHRLGEDGLRCVCVEENLSFRAGANWLWNSGTWEGSQSRYFPSMVYFFSSDINHFNLSDPVW